MVRVAPFLTHGVVSYYCAALNAYVAVELPNARWGGPRRLHGALCGKTGGDVAHPLCRFKKALKRSPSTESPNSSVCQSSTVCQAQENEFYLQMMIGTGSLNALPQTPVPIIPAVIP